MQSEPIVWYANEVPFLDVRMFFALNQLYASSASPASILLRLSGMNPRILGSSA